MARLLARRRLKNLLLFIPNMVLLCARLLTDSRVPGTERALLAGAIVYAIIPFDLIPDMIPFFGQVDDMYLIALTLLRLLDRTDPKVVREHWSGGGDVVELIGAAGMLAAKFLPAKVRRILTARVEVAPGKLEDFKDFRKPLLVARPEPEGAGAVGRSSQQ
ncbi:MAG: YkvA family protein [bacterium]